MGRLWAAAYRRADRLCHLGVHGLRVLHEGLWLGLSTSDDLIEINRQQYEAWPRYQDRGFNLEGLRPWEAAAVERYFPARGRVLVSGCGGGREALALARRGFRVSACDPSPNLVEAARRLSADREAGFEVALAPPSGLPAEGAFEDRPFDAALLGWGAYMHIPSARRRIAFLRSHRRRLRPAAPVLLSFFAYRTVPRRLVWTWRLARALRAVRAPGEPPELGDSLCETFDHHFSRAALEAELEAAGLIPVTFDREPYGHAVAKVPASG